MKGWKTAKQVAEELLAPKDFAKIEAVLEEVAIDGPRWNEDGEKVWSEADLKECQQEIYPSWIRSGKWE